MESEIRKEARITLTLSLDELAMLVHAYEAAFLPEALHGAGMQKQQYEALLAIFREAKK